MKEHIPSFPPEPSLCYVPIEESVLVGGQAAAEGRIAKQLLVLFKAVREFFLLLLLPNQITDRPCMLALSRLKVGELGAAVDERKAVSESPTMGVELAKT